MPSALPSLLPVAGRLVEKRPTMKRFAEPPILWTIKQVGEQEETDPRCSFSTLDDFGQECKALTGQQVEERTPLAADTVNREERDQLFIPSDRAPTLLFVTPNEQTAATA